MAAKSASLQWLSLVGVLWLQSINGTNSNFPAYSSELKQLLSLSQLQLNNLALASDAGKLFGCLAGIAAIYLPLWLLLLIGSTLGFIGYGFQYLFLTHHISSLSYSLLFFLTLLAGNGICWINTVCYLVTIRNFPLHRQAAVGLTTSYLGLSAVIYSAFVDALSSTPIKSAQYYMLFNSVFPLLVSVATAPFMCSVDTQKATKIETGFVVLFIITIATGVYAVVSSLGRMSMRSSSPWLNVIGVVACLALPLLVPLTECFGDILGRDCIINKERRVCDVTRESQEGAKEFETNRMKEDENTAGPKIWAIEEIGVKLMMKRLDFWLYFFIYLFGATLGLVYLNNLGQIADSRGYSKTTSLVSLASAFVFFGRLLPSLLNYVYSSKMMVSGPASIVAAMVPMPVAFFLLRDGSSVCLHLSTSIIGFCTGAITAISVSTTTELFGVDNFGVNHNLVVANIPVGSFLFGGAAAVMYRKQGQGDGERRCMGLQCYNMIFMIWGTLSLLGTALAFLLHFRTRKFYLQLRS